MSREGWQPARCAPHMQGTPTSQHRGCLFCFDRICNLDLVDCCSDFCTPWKGFLLVFFLVLTQTRAGRKSDVQTSSAALEPFANKHKARLCLITARMLLPRPVVLTFASTFADDLCSVCLVIEACAAASVESAIIQG
jgi:hypothetical protein